MNKRNYFFLPHLVVCICSFLILGNKNGLAQENQLDSLTHFEVILEQAKGEIHMSSVQGCAWYELSFTLKENQEQAVDAYGMAPFNRVNKKANDQLADFLFTISRIDNDYILTGKEGTAWTNVRFSLQEGEKQGLNERGLLKN